MRFTRYSDEIELSRQQFYLSLAEKDRRRYVAVEALKLGHGGVGYLASLFGCSEKTIHRGLDELLTPPELPAGRSRKKGEDASVAATPLPDWTKTFSTSCALTPPGIPCGKKSAGPI